MPNTKNIQEVKELESKLEGASAVYLADYAGLSVPDQVELRARVEQEGGALRITKNRLLKLALDKHLDGLPREVKDFLRGPNITLFAGSDVVGPLKALVEFAAGTGSKKPALKTGFLGTELLSLEKIKELATLPGKTELVAKLLNTLTNPARSLVGVLAAPTRDLVYVLNAYKEQKQAA